MIRWTRLSLRRGAKLLLEDADTTIQPGEKVGLVGANGSGKSSLFALVLGKLSADQGDQSIPGAWRIAHVAQEAAIGERLAIDFVIDGDTRLRAIEAAIATHTARDVPGSSSSGGAQASDDAAADHALAESHVAYGDAGGYTATARAEALLLGLGFRLDETRRPVHTFSGGWRMRLHLAKALMSPSDLLLLDEPTNHLDLDAIVWLEQWLRSYAGTLLVISHDREFLDAACDAIVSIEDRKLQRWTGGYSAYEQQRLARLQQQRFAHAAQQREIAHLERFVERFRAKASKAKQAQSRVKALERMTRVAAVHDSASFRFRFREPLASPDPMLIMDGVDCGYRVDGDGSDRAQANSRVVVHGLDLRLSQGERIGLLGANGQGKSTVIKTIAGTLDRLAGTITPGKGLAIGYFAQHQVDMLDLGSSALEQLHRIASHGPGTPPREQELRDFLGSFGFGAEMATAPVAPFSGGEKARLALALIVWSRPNLLLLDEPTNHLDLETREALTRALAGFDGTLILVSHDRALLRATADRLLLVSDGRCTEFDGDLDDYRAWSLKRRAVSNGDIARQPRDAVSSNTRAPGPPPAPRDRRRDDAATRAAIASRRKPIEQRIRRIETKLADAEARRSAVERVLAEPGAYDETRRESLTEHLIEQAYVAKEIAELEAEWLEQQALLEEAA